MQHARRHWRRGALVVIAALVIAGVVGALSASGQATTVTFKMVRSTGAKNAGCLIGATANVSITPQGQVEEMTVSVSHLPANTDFDLFVIQVPDAPFGMSWYQGDVETNADGNGSTTFHGRFSIETFVVAPGSAPAPHPHPADATSNPATAPVHTYHLGLWFNSTTDAAAAGCPGAQTPFNGDHTAGVQAMSTRNFAPATGPLRQVH